MVLVTGPTGSGKTVSLYTCLNILNKPGVNISTAEDPAEIKLPGINQVNVNDKAGPDVRRRAASAFLRQDPDVIMVGEIRDLETGRHRDQGRADRPHGAVDAAHQRRADDAHAPDEHGHRAVQHRLVGDPDHRAAPGAPALHLQAAGGHSTKKRCIAAGFTEEDLDGSWQPYQAGRLRALQGHRATRAASASTR